MPVIDTGGPAFPSAEPESVFVEELGRYIERLGPPQGGMSLRDYFAGQALMGYLATYGEHAHPATNGTADAVAEYSYAIADAMLKARHA